MSNIQAALGLAQFERINELIDRKRLIFSWYEKRLDEIEGLHLNKEADWAKSIYWMTSIFLENDFGILRNELMNRLKEDGVDTRPVFPTISKYPMWESGCHNPNAIAISENSINLPSGHNLEEDQIDYICNSIIKHLNI
jgi:perosamine synthetase